MSIPEAIDTPSLLEGFISDASERLVVLLGVLEEAKRQRVEEYAAADMNQRLIDTARVRRLLQQVYEVEIARDVLEEYARLLKHTEKGG